MQPGRLPRQAKSKFTNNVIATVVIAIVVIATVSIANTAIAETEFAREHIHIVVPSRISPAGHHVLSNSGIPRLFAAIAFVAAVAVAQIGLRVDRAGQR